MLLQETIISRMLMNWNDTERGRQLNRRVELAIFANEELKEAARNGDLGNE